MYRSTWALLGLVVVLGAVALWVRSRDPLSRSRALRPLDFEPRAVRGLEILGPYGRIELLRESGEWTVVAPFRYPADLHKVAGLVAYLGSLRADRPLPHGATAPDALTRAGLTGEGVVRFKVVLDDGSMRSGIVGRPPRIGERAFMAVTGRKGVVALAQPAAAVFFAPPDAFRDPRALRLELPDLVAVTVENVDRRISLERRAPGHWVLAEPAQGPVHPVALGRLWTLLGRLRVTSWLDATVEPAGPGLEPPRRRLSAVSNLEGDIREDTLVVGTTREDGQVYGKRAAADVVFTLDPENVEPLFALRPEDLRDDVLLRIRPGDLASVAIEVPGAAARVFAWDGEGWRRPDGGTVSVREGEELGTLLAMMANHSLERFVEGTAGDGFPGLRPPALVVRLGFRGRHGVDTVEVGRAEGGWIYFRRNSESIAGGIPAEVAGPEVEPFLR